MKPDKKIQDAIIYFLICVILVIGYWGFNYYKNMKHVINHSVYSNLYTTQHILRDINDEIVKYDNKQITNNELHNLISENKSSLFITTYTTEKYEYISKRLEYVDICELGDYIDVLDYTDLSDEELEYHIKNVQKICKLLNEVDINLTDNYFKPSKRLKETLEEINTLSEKGYNLIDNMNDCNSGAEDIKIYNSPIYNQLQKDS